MFIMILLAMFGLKNLEVAAPALKYPIKLAFSGINRTLKFLYQIDAYEAC